MIVYPAAGDSHIVLGTTATIKLSDTDGQLAAVLHSVPLNAGPPPQLTDAGKVNGVQRAELGRLHPTGLAQHPVIHTRPLLSAHHAAAAPAPTL